MISSFTNSISAGRKPADIEVFLVGAVPLIPNGCHSHSVLIILQLYFFLSTHVLKNFYNLFTKV